MQRTGFTVTDRIVNDVQGKNIISRKANIHARIRFSHVELAFLVTRSFGTNSYVWKYDTFSNKGVLKNQAYMNIHT